MLALLNNEKTHQTDCWKSSATQGVTAIYASADPDRYAAHVWW